jgi:hypothetical protein
MKEHRELQTLIDELERHITHQGKEVDRLHEVNAELLEALQAFDNAAKESTTIITFAGRSLKLLTQARAAIAKAEEQA